MYLCRMNSCLNYTVPYGKDVRKELKNRSQKYNHVGQFFSTLFSPKMGHKMPLLIKLPCISSLFSKIPPEHHLRKVLSKNSEGLVNRLYYMPNKFPSTGMELPAVKSLKIDLKKNFKMTRKIEILKKVYKAVKKNLNFKNTGAVKMKDQKDWIKFEEDKEQATEIERGYSDVKGREMVTKKSAIASLQNNLVIALHNQNEDITNRWLVKVCVIKQRSSNG